MSTQHAKPIKTLQVSDLETHPVWQYADGGERDDTAVRPVKRLPVSTLGSKVVGTRVRLANGNPIWALIGNLDTRSARMNQHFLTLSIEHDGKWFDLARYHDLDYGEHGPDALARFLGLSISDVFPISYDVRRYAKGEAEALVGSIPKEPRIRLSRAEIIAMAVP